MRRKNNPELYCGFDASTNLKQSGPGPIVIISIVRCWCNGR